MKNLTFLIVFIFSTVAVFSQAREENDPEYKTVYEIFLYNKKGELKHVIPQGNQINAEVNGKRVAGRWFYKAKPDVITVVNRKGEPVGEAELNKQTPLKIVSPTPRGGNVGVGVGVGAVAVSDFGPGYSTFNMLNWKAEINERQETKEEKSRREYYEQKEQERLSKEAAKKAKKEAKKKKK